MLLFTANMSQGKYFIGGQTQLQDPEAILSMGSISEKDEKILTSSNSCNEKESNESNVNYNFEYPTVTINGEPTVEVKTNNEADHLSVQRSRIQSISEPDLTQVNLYCNHNELLSSSALVQPEDVRRKGNPKIGNDTFREI